MIFTKNFNNKSRTQVTPIKGWAYNVSKSAVVMDSMAPKPTMSLYNVDKSN